jgi:AAA domain, putative AbiEii toxin, Type IV TA system
VLRRVRLLRFRGFSEFVAELGPSTAMIGRNSSGKTSVLQAIRLAYDATQLALDSEDGMVRATTGAWLLLGNRIVVADPSRLISLTDWRQIFTNAEVGDGVTATIELEFDESDPITKLRVELVYGRNSQLVTSVHAESPTIAATMSVAKRSKDRRERVRDELRRTLPIAVFVPAFYGVTRLEEYRAAPVMSRALGGGDQSHIVRNLVARLDGLAIERMNRFLTRTVGAKVESWTPAPHVETVEHLTVAYSDNNGRLELSSAGAGLVSMIALWAALERTREMKASPPSRAAVFLLDEPEAHMHPRLQGDLGEHIAAAAADFDVQLLIATHSVEMINRLGRQPAATLLAIDRAAPAAVMLTSEAEIVRMLDEFCDLSPYTGLSFLASRRVVFHEGPSDWKILDACARFYFRSDDRRRIAWQRYVPIPLDGVGNVSAHGVLEKLLTPKLFPTAISAAQPVRAVLVRDRDAEREPKAPQLHKAAPHIETIDVVWSRYSIESLFLDLECLVAWLEPLELADLPALRVAVAAALAEVNQNTTLLDAAIDQRERALARADKAGNVNPKVAKKQARDDVRGKPEVWQHGRDRAKRILHHVRKALPGPQQRRLRGALDDVIDTADPNQLGDVRVVLPSEIRALLDAMVQ